MGLPFPDDKIYWAKKKTQYLQNRLFPVSLYINDYLMVLVQHQKGLSSWHLKWGKSQNGMWPLYSISVPEDIKKPRMLPSAPNPNWNDGPIVPQGLAMD